MTGTLAVFGITGRTGRAVAREATTRGWGVRDLARPGSTLADELSSVHIVRGDFNEPARIAERIFVSRR